MRKRSSASWAMLIVFIPQMMFGAQILVRPTQSGRTSDVFAFSDATTSYANAASAFKVNLNVTCFSTNLRMVENPISPFAAVHFEIDLRSGTKFSVVFPGWLVMNDRLTNGAPPNVQDKPANLVTYLAGVPNAFPANAIKNTVTFDIPAGHPNGAAFDAQGNLTNINVYGMAIQRLAFRQDQTSGYGKPPTMFKMDKKNPVKPWGIEKLFASVMTPFKWLSWNSEKTFAGGGLGGDGGDGGDGAAANQLVNLDNHADIGWGQPNKWPFAAGPTDPESMKYMGKDGPLSGNWEATWSADYRTLNVNASFPGQVGFCGGFFSPLMLFFDSKVPEFSAVASFKMSSYYDRTTWPEAGSPGAFLVLDRNHDGIINDVTEMFGSEDNSTNGFELLRVFDENEDGVIDAKDPVFNELRLWSDSTGKGTTLKKDLRTLKAAGVESISLKYDNANYAPVGDRAELRERAEFIFSNHGKKQQGKVIDVWFKGSN